jgi:replicative DNA helicase
MLKNLYNQDFERAVLSTIIFEENMREDIFSSQIESHDFFIPFHQKLFNALQYLNEHSAIEESLIKSYMGREFNESLMLDVLASVPLSNVMVYIEQLKDLSKLRQFKQLAHRILQNVEEEGNFSKTLSLVHEEIEKVEKESRALFDIVPLSQVKAEEAEFICKSWLPFPKNAVSLVTAGGGVGKSFLLLQAAMRMVREEKLKIFMWLSEDPLSLSRYRFEMIAQQILEEDLSLFGDNLHLAGADSETIHFLEESRGGVSVSSKFYQFKAALKAYDVIILDPLIAMFGADENNNAHARKFINLFTRWATREQKTIVFIHHGTKNTSQSRGASAFVDAVRLVYKVEHIKNENGEVVEDENRWVILDKDNNGAKKYLGAAKIKRQIFPRKRKVVEIEYT